MRGSESHAISGHRGLFRQHVLFKLRVGEEPLVDLNRRFRFAEILLFEARFLDQLKELFGAVFNRKYLLHWIPAVLLLPDEVARHTDLVSV